MPGAPSHWTYDGFGENAALCQGDIIGRTAELEEEVLRQAHLYFLDPKYVAFMVLTQTCDLVPRSSGSCKTEHISLAVIRELHPVLPDMIHRIAGTEVPGVYRQSLKRQAIDRVKRVLNQNETAHGLFYLHPDGDAGISVESVALLRVSIAVRKDHYAILQRARTGRLRPEFQNKVGWLCGHLFARAATPDWEPNDADKQARTLVQQAAADKTWVPEKWFSELKRSNSSISGLEADAALTLLQSKAPKEPKALAIERASVCAAKALAGLYAAALRAELAKSDEFSAALSVRLESCFIQADVDVKAAQGWQKVVDLAAESFTNSLRPYILHSIEATTGDPSDAVLAAKPPSAIRNWIQQLGGTLAAEVSLAEGSLTVATVSVVQEVVAQIPTDLPKKMSNLLKNDPEFNRLLAEPEITVFSDDD
jgi:hypothetical protein